MRVSLIVDVEDLVGYREGLPAILKLLDEYKIQATFLFSLGYDNSGLRIKNLFNPSVLTSQLPLSQKFLGTLLPPVSLSRKFKNQIKTCYEAGHDVGIKSFDSVDWQFHALTADYEWTRRGIQWSIDTFSEILGCKPLIHSASAFVVNPHLFRLESEFGFKVAIDTRGKTAFIPDYQGVHGKVIQLPVTLPAIEELLQIEDIDRNNIHEYLFVESQKQLPHGHVWQIRAAFEGRAWLDVLEKMIVMWRGSQWEFTRVNEIVDQLSIESVKTHHVGWAQYLPQKRYMATQSLPVDLE